MTVWFTKNLVLCEFFDQGSVWWRTNSRQINSGAGWGSWSRSLVRQVTGLEIRKRWEVIGSSATFFLNCCGSMANFKALRVDSPRTSRKRPSAAERKRFKNWCKFQQLQQDFAAQLILQKKTYNDIDQFASIVQETVLCHLEELSIWELNICIPCQSTQLGSDISRYQPRFTKHCRLRVFQCRNAYINVVLNSCSRM